MKFIDKFLQKKSKPEDKKRVKELRKKYDRLYPDLVEEVCNISWHTTPNEETLGILRRFLAKYKEIPADDVNIELDKRYNFAGKIMYTKFLLSMDEYFRKGEITCAGDRLENIIRYFPLFQAGLKENLTKLLEKYI